MNLQRELSYPRNAGVMLAQSIVQRAMGMVSTVVLARLLGTSEFGAYSVVMNTASAFYGIFKLGLDGAINVNLASEVPDDESRITMGQLLGTGLILMLTTAVVGTAAILLLANFLAIHVYGQEKLGAYLLFSGALFFVQTLSQYCWAVLSGLHRFKPYAFIQIVSSLGSLPLIAVGCWTGGLLGGVIANVLSQAITMLLLVLAVRGTLSVDKLSISFALFGARIKQLLKIGLPFYLSALFLLPVTYYLQGVISKHEGLDSLGYLRVVMPLASIVSFVPASISVAMITMLAQEKRNSSEIFWQRVFINLKVVWAFAMLVSLALVTVLPWLVHFLYGAKYMPSITAGYVVIFSAGFGAVTSILSNACVSSKRMDIILFYAFFHAGMFAIAGLILVPRMGLMGYVWSELIAACAVLVMSAIHSRAWLKQSQIDASWLYGLFGINCVVAIPWVLQAFVKIPVLVNTVVGCISVLMVGTWCYVKVFDKSEIQVFKRALRGIVSNRMG